MLPGKKLTPADILQVVRRRWWLVAVPPLLTLFVALLYSSKQTDMYQSDMLISIDPQRVPDAFVRSTVTMETDRRLDSLQVQVLSRTALAEMVEKFNLYPEERARLPIEDVLTLMRQNITVDLQFAARPRAGQMQPTAFHVRFTYDDPKIAAKITQELGSLFVSQNLKDRGTLAGATSKFLESQLAESRAKLEAQDAKLESFRQRYGKELPTQMQSNMQALSSSQLQAQSLVESIARDRDRKQMLERLYRERANEPVAARPAAATPEQNAVAALTQTNQQQLATARAQLASLEQRYRADHPDVARAKRRVAELEPLAASEARPSTATATTTTAAATSPTVAGLDPDRRENLRQMMAEIESLDRQVAFKESEETRVRGEISEYQRRLEAVPGLESEWVKLTRDYETMQTAYRDLLTKSTAAQVATDLESQDIGERFRIVDEAAVPVHPLPSMRMRYNAIGFGVGLALGLAIAALLELRDRTFRSESDILEVMGMPVLAIVPRIDSAAEKLLRRRKQWAVSLVAASAAVVIGYVSWSLELWNSLL